MKILIFKIGAIGDVIMSTPLIRQLRRDYPDAQIDYLVGHIASALLEGNKNLDEILRFDEKIFFKANALKLLKLIRTIRKRRYDMVFVLDKHKILHWTAKMFKIPVRVGFDRLGKEGNSLTKRVYFDGSKHEIHYDLEQLEKAGGKVDYSDDKTEMFLDEHDERFASDIWKSNGLDGKRVIAVCPGGAKNPGQKAELKIWPMERYKGLVKELIDKNHAKNIKTDVKIKIILLGDHNDVQTCEYIRDGNPDCIDMSGKATIKQSAAMMKRCDAVICNDSGPMHIATTVNDKVISIFGPTDPKRFAPLNPKSKYIWKPGKCCPCNDIYGSFGKCRGKECMMSVQVEDVLRCV